MRFWDLANVINLFHEWSINGNMFGFSKVVTNGSVVLMNAKLLLGVLDAPLLRPSTN